MVLDLLVLVAVVDLEVVEMKRQGKHCIVVGLEEAVSLLGYRNMDLLNVQSRQRRCKVHFDFDLLEYRILMLQVLVGSRSYLVLAG